MFKELGINDILQKRSHWHLLLFDKFDNRFRIILYKSATVVRQRKWQNESTNRSIKRSVYVLHLV